MEQQPQQQPSIQPLSIQYKIGIQIVFLSLLFVLKKYFNGGVNQFKPNMTEKIIILTGATAGIGRCTAIQLAKLGATIVCACRDIKKGQNLVQEITQETKNKNIHCLELDLSSLKSIKQFVKEFQKKFSKLDVLINNAGVMAVGKKQITSDNLELQMATNYFGPFLLTNLLIQQLKAAGEGSRIINVSSEAHRFSMLDLDNLNSEKQYDPFVTQGNTKLANILFTQEFANQYQNCNIKVVALHPGSVRTNLQKQSNFVIKIFFLLIFPMWFVTKSPQQGAQTSLYCSLMPFEKLQNGKYYKDCKIASTSYKANNQEEFATKLWVISKKLVGLSS